MVEMHNERRVDDTHAKVYLALGHKCFCRAHLHRRGENVRLKLARNLLQKKVEVGPLVDVHQITVQ